MVAGVTYSHLPAMLWEGRMQKAVDNSYAGSWGGTEAAHILISRKNYTYAVSWSWIFKALRISRCALDTSVRI